MELAQENSLALSINRHNRWFRSGLPLSVNDSESHDFNGFSLGDKTLAHGKSRQPRVGLLHQARNDRSALFY